MTVNVWGDAAGNPNQAEEQSTARVWTIVLLTPQIVQQV